MGRQKRIRIAKQKRKQLSELGIFLKKNETAANKAAKSIGNIGVSFKQACRALNVLMKNRVAKKQLRE